MEDVEHVFVDFISSMFAEILSKEVNCTEIQFTEDGGWRAMKPDSDECFIPDSPSGQTTDHPTVSTSESASVGKN